jgi:hypothetical protein
MLGIMKLYTCSGLFKHLQGKKKKKPSTTTQKQSIQYHCSSHPDFDAMRQHVLMDQRLLQQLERVGFEMFLFSTKLTKKMFRQIQS